jgi:peroxiredoxin Q/BCP
MNRARVLRSASRAVNSGMTLRAILAGMLAMGFFGFGQKLRALEVGDAAPAIVAPDQDGKDFAFADTYAKGITLVFFYPKADTPGCTAQACSLRDSFADLTAENLQVVGVSRDTPEAQLAFRKKHNLPFTLVADKDGKVAEAFGVPGMLGLPVSKRQSFLVKDGKIAWKSPSAQTGGHAAEVQAALDKLQEK